MSTVSATPRITRASSSRTGVQTPPTSSTFKRPRSVSSSSTISNAGNSQQMATPSPIKKTRSSLGGWSDGEVFCNKENVAPERRDADDDELLLVAGPSTLSRKRSVGSTSGDNKRGKLVRTESIASEDAFSTISHASTAPSSPPVPVPSIFTTLRSLLRCSTTFSSATPPLVGRTTERAAVQAFLAPSSDSNADKRTMYVAGQPGTGKTALVSSVVRALVDGGEHGDWREGTVNCVGLHGAEKDVWEACARALGFNSGGKSARDWLENGLKKAKKGVQFVLILDELDSLISLSASSTSSQPTSSTLHLLTTLFLLPSTHANLHLITIANSLDFPTRYLSSLPTPPVLLPFSAYNNADLSAIVRARLRSILPEGDRAEGDGQAATPGVEDRAVELASRKVQAENGDLRMCLDVCRMAIELVEGEQRKKALVKAGVLGGRTATPVALTSGSSPAAMEITKHLTSFSATDAPRAGMTHILKALAAAKSTSSSSAAPQAPAVRGGAGLVASPAKARAPSSATISKIKSLNIQSRLILVALLVHSRRISWGLPALATSRTISSSAATPTGKALLITTTSTLYPTYHHLLSSSDSPLSPVTPSDFLTLLSNLSDAALLGLAPLTPSKRRSASEKKVEMACLEEEVVKGLVGNGSEGVVEEEARRILEREEDRMGRQRENRRREEVRLKETCTEEERL